MKPGEIYDFLNHLLQLYTYKVERNFKSKYSHLLEYLTWKYSRDQNQCLIPRNVFHLLAAIDFHVTGLQYYAAG